MNNGIKWAIRMIMMMMLVCMCDRKVPNGQKFTIGFNNDKEVNSKVLHA